MTWNGPPRTASESWQSGPGDTQRRSNQAQIEGERPTRVAGSGPHCSFGGLLRLPAVYNRSDRPTIVTSVLRPLWQLLKIEHRPHVVHGCLAGDLPIEARLVLVSGAF